MTNTNVIVKIAIKERPKTNNRLISIAIQSKMIIFTSKYKPSNPANGNFISYNTMKQLLSLLLLMTPCMITAQVKVIPSDTLPLERKPVYQYDSTDISTIHPEKYIGQKVILYQNKGVLRYGWDNKTYDAPLFTYFEITGFKAPQTFQMKRCDNGDECSFDFFGSGVKPVMAVGYYESIAKARDKSRWIIKGKDGVWQIVDTWLGEGGIRHKLELVGDTLSISLQTLWGQKSYAHYVDMMDRYRNDEWVVDENNSYGRVDTIKVINGTPYLVFKDGRNKTYTFDMSRAQGRHYISIGDLPFFTKSDGVKYAHKYGITRWKQILSGDVKIGFTKEMVALSIGYPNQSASKTNAYDDMDIWEYGTGLETIVFKNGKVCEIWNK